MAQQLEKLEIRFETKNAEKVKADLKKLGIEFEKTGKKGKKSFNRLRVETEGLRRNLGIIRNQMLLVTFATAGAATAFGGFIRAAGQIEQFESRLRAMSQSAEIAKRQLAGFMEIAATTPFTVQEIVQGGVQLEAFGAKAEPLIPVMANLAAIMGRTVPEAANAFGRAFAGGRGAADVFRETGILTIIDEFNSLDETLNKSGLSLGEFRIKMLEALADPEGKVANGIKELEGTLFQSISNMQDSIFVFQATVGKELAPTFIQLAKQVTRFFKTFADNDPAIRRFISAIRVLIVTGFAALTQSIFNQIGALAALALSYRTTVGTTVAFRTALAGLNAQLARNAIVIAAISAATIFEALRNQTAAAEDLDNQIKDGVLTFEEYLDELRKVRDAEAFEKQNKDAAENIIKLEQRLAVLKANNDVQRAQAVLTRQLKDEEISLIQQIEGHNKALEAQLELQKQLEKFNRDFAKEQSEFRVRALADEFAKRDLQKTLTADELKNEVLKNETLTALREKHRNDLQLQDRKSSLLGQTNLIKDAGERAEKIAAIESFFRDLKLRNEEEFNKRMAELRDEDAAGLLTKLTEESEAIRNFNELRVQSMLDMFNGIQSAFSNMIRNNMDAEIRALKKTDKFRNASTEQRQDMENDIKAKFAEQQRMAFRLQQLSQIAQVFMTLARASFEIEAASKAAFAAGDKTAIAQGKALITGLKISSGIQAGLIAGQKQPAFATGGSFITSGPQSIMVGDNPGGRERVDVTPLSSPNIDGPQGSEVTVNIMGNVIGTEEFVRDNLIPEIDRSIRRNLA
tara:strand:- start:10946 stop:13348 length:2403 start_codon:yes stop_codon:yes gene_type:complete